MAGDTLFADMLLPVPIPRLFTYRVPAALNNSVAVGQRAIVQFGQKKILTGIIARLHNQPPQEYEAKLLLDLLGAEEIISTIQFRFFEWMAGYYMCTEGEVLKAALPSGLKLSSESRIQIHPGFDRETSSHDFSEKEEVILRHLQQESMTYTEAARILGTKSIYAILKSLSGKDAIVLYEEVKEKYKPKVEHRIRLAALHANEESLEKLFARLGDKPKQEDILLRYLQKVPVSKLPDLNNRGVSRGELLDEAKSDSPLKTLIKHGIFEEFEQVIPRFSFDQHVAPPLLLSEQQTTARNEILKGFEQKPAALLHGVTGSGKTEIYIDLIRRALDSGTQVLYLLPEIALTTQIVVRLKKNFGNTLGIYHSKFSDNERVEVWQNLMSGKTNLVVGVRSSVFLPFDNLGLVIVDEEHDPSYKQQEPAPRYQARDAALMLASLHNAKVLLGSATPSLESFYHARQGRYGWVTLNQRFGDAQLPRIELANLSREKKQKTAKGEFTSHLLNAMQDALGRKEQVILFQNRRGHSPFLQCNDCGWLAKCRNCAVSLTYHQYRHAVVCHYCGYHEDVPAQCPTCSSRQLLTLGYGTEKLEEELRLHFPEAEIQRMDLDTTRSKHGYESILEDFESGKTHVLVGTQMVTKGLDFDHVSLVCIFDADRMMHFPDFRSHERAFQLMMQVSGRAGRRDKPGQVVIQTNDPQHTLFQWVQKHDVVGFLEHQLKDREQNFYPPFFRLIALELRHADKNVVHPAANQLASELRNTLHHIRILGPAEPMIGKIRNEFRMNLLLKIRRDQGQLAVIKQELLKASDHLHTRKEFRNVRIVFDVDPN
ncbi:MAG: primosomal protein N' [Cyclobacteriaceae bacterium]|jgi:primosomal protein N' (replication factor Y)